MIFIAGTYFFNCLYVAILFSLLTAHPVDIVYNPNTATGRTHDMVLNFSEENRNPMFDVVLPLNLSNYDFYACKADWEKRVTRGRFENSPEFSAFSDEHKERTAA